MYIIHCSFSQNINKYEMLTTKINAIFNQKEVKKKSKKSHILLLNIEFSLYELLDNPDGAPGGTTQDWFR